MTETFGSKIVKSSEEINILGELRKFLPYTHSYVLVVVWVFFWGGGWVLFFSFYFFELSLTFNL